MLYYKTIWNHRNDYEPIIMYSEIDAERFETKRLDIFPTGEFDVSEISAIDFENILKMYDTEALIEDYCIKLARWAER